MSWLSTVGSALDAVTALATNRTELEKKLDECLSKANWGAPSSLLKELAAVTFDPTDYAVVMRETWNALNHAGKNWRQIYKGLVLLEYLIKYGSERVVDDARDHLFRIRTLTDFTHHEEGADKGAGIREKAKSLVELLNDNRKLREERENAQRLRDKYIGMSNAGTPYAERPAGSMGGISSGDAGAPYRQDRDEWSRNRGGGRYTDNDDTSSAPSREDSRQPVGGRGGGGDDDFDVAAAVASVASDARPSSAGTGPRGGRRHTLTDENDSRTPAKPAHVGGRAHVNAGGSTSGTTSSARRQPGGTGEDEFATAFSGATGGGSGFDPFASAGQPHAKTAAPTGGRSAAPAQRVTAPGGDFDPFKPSSSTAPAPPPARTVQAPAQQSRPAPATAGLDDLFSAPVATSHTTTAGGDFGDFAAAPAPSRPAVFDPFSVPPGAFASPPASQSASLGGARSPDGHDFGAFTTPTAPADQDVSRLVSLDNLHKPKGSSGPSTTTGASSTAPRAAVPMNAMAKTQSVSGAGSTAPMGASTAGRAQPPMMSGGVGLSSVGMPGAPGLGGMGGMGSGVPGSMMGGTMGGVSGGMMAPGGSGPMYGVPPGGVGAPYGAPGPMGYPGGMPGAPGLVPMGYPGMAPQMGGMAPSMGMGGPMGMGMGAPMGMPGGSGMPAYGMQQAPRPATQGGGHGGFDPFA